MTKKSFTFPSVFSVISVVQSDFLSPYKLSIKRKKINHRELREMGNTKAPIKIRATTI